MTGPAAAAGEPQEVVAAEDDATFWDALPVGHRVALFATPFAALGGLGPFARGTLVSGTLAGGASIQETVVYGYARDGWLIAVPAILSFLVLLLVKDRQKRSARVLGLMLLAGLVALAETFTGGLLLEFQLRWSDVSLQWGPPLALVASLAAVVGALWGSRDRSQPPTY